jgi:hypothetical protein
MPKFWGVLLILVGALLVSQEARACRSCSLTSNWDPNCAHTGCTYCAACSICCGGNPNAGGHCAVYCGGGALSASTEGGLSQIFSAAAEEPSELPEFLAAPVPASSSSCASAQP